MVTFKNVKVTELKNQLQGETSEWKCNIDSTECCARLMMKKKEEETRLSRNEENVCRDKTTIN